MNPTFSLWPEPLAPESRLLLLCACTRLDSEAAKSISDLAAGPLDWGVLIALAARNSIVPLLEMNLRSAASERVPPPVLTRLTDLVRVSTAKNLLLSGELIKLSSLFRSHNIETIPYKGPVLAIQAYGNIALREFDDLDVIVSQKQMAQAHEVMLSLGYRAKFPWILPAPGLTDIPGEYNYFDEPRRILVELHTEFTLRHFPVVPHLEDFSRRLVSASLSGHDIATFSPEDALPVLCIHGAKDFWERLSWVADLSELIRSHPGLDWDRTFRVSESLKAGRMFHLGLALALGLLNAPLPVEVAARVRQDSAAAALAASISSRLVSPDWTELDAAARFRFRCLMLPGFAGWRYAARLALMPGEEDFTPAGVARPLAPLQVVLRPLRLLRKYGWRAGRSPRPLP
jgi:hypothetical protein